MKQQQSHMNYQYLHFYSLVQKLSCKEEEGVRRRGSRTSLCRPLPVMSIWRCCQERHQRDKTQRHLISESELQKGLMVECGDYHTLLLLCHTLWSWPGRMSLSFSLSASSGIQQLLRPVPVVKRRTLCFDSNNSDNIILF